MMLVREKYHNAFQQQCGLVVKADSTHADRLSSILSAGRKKLAVGPPQPDKIDIRMSL